MWVRLMAGHRKSVQFRHGLGRWRGAAFTCALWRRGDSQDCSFCACFANIYTTGSCLPLQKLTCVPLLPLDPFRRARLPMHSHMELITAHVLFTLQFHATIGG